MVGLQGGTSWQSCPLRAQSPFILPRLHLSLAHNLIPSENQLLQECLGSCANGGSISHCAGSVPQCGPASFTWAYVYLYSSSLSPWKVFTFFYVQMHKRKQPFATTSAQIVRLEMSGWDFPKVPIPSLDFLPKLAMATCPHLQGLWQVPSSSRKVNFTNGLGGPSSVEVGHRRVGRFKLFSAFLPRSYHLLSSSVAFLLPSWTWPLLTTKPQPAS